MGFLNREIELKLVAKGQTSLEQVADLIASKIRAKKTLAGFSKDIFWKAPHGRKDFVRLRYLDGGKAQVTLKRIDKGDNFDREEIDLEVQDPDQARELLSSLLGEPLGAVKKTYKVFWTDTKDTTISVYKVNGDARIFIEIEARSRKKVLGLKIALERRTKICFNRW